MNVHKSVPDCSKQVENLASWNICVKGIQTLIRELLQGHQHIFLNDIRNCLLTSMKKRKIDLKKSKQGLLCFYWENKTRFQETSIFQKKKNKKKNCSFAKPTQKEVQVESHDTMQPEKNIGLARKFIRVFPYDHTENPR